MGKNIVYIGSGATCGFRHALEMYGLRVRNVCPEGKKGLTTVCLQIIYVQVSI